MGESKFDFLYFPACVNEKNSEYPTAHFRKMNRQEMKKCPAIFSLRAVPKIKKTCVSQVFFGFRKAKSSIFLNAAFALGIYLLFNYTAVLFSIAITSSISTLLSS